VRLPSASAAQGGARLSPNGDVLEFWIRRPGFSHFRGTFGIGFAMLSWAEKNGSHSS